MLGPALLPGLCTGTKSMKMRGRVFGASATSRSSGQVNPSGPHHWATCFGSVNASNARCGAASTMWEELDAQFRAHWTM